MTHRDTHTTQGGLPISVLVLVREWRVRGRPPLGSQYMTMEKQSHIARENSRKNMSTRIYTVFWHRLGPCVTKEELESVYQKIESVTRIFEKMSLFCVFFKKN